MKNKLEHIDKLFLEGAVDDAANFSAKKGWRAMKLRLLLSEIINFNFVNVNWNYVVYGGILLLLFSLPWAYLGLDDEKVWEAEATNTSEVWLPALESNSNSTLHEAPQKIKELAKPQVTQAQTGMPDQIDKPAPFAKQQPGFTEITPSKNMQTRNTNRLEIIESKILISEFEVRPEKMEVRSTSIRQPSNSEAKDVFGEQELSGSSQNFMLGFNMGSVFLLNESPLGEEIHQPMWFGGFNFRYNRPHFFIETAVEFSYYTSTLNSTYRYDSVIGTITSAGYDIIEVTNDNGETVLERQYHSELVSIYDTLSSNDEVTISSNSAVLCIPLTVGTKVFQRGNFYTSLFAGTVFKLLLVKNQSLPGFGADDRRIIEYENNPVISYEPEFYFQGGLLFGYEISKSFSLEIRSAYNHILGGNSSLFQNSKASIQVGFGINYTF